MSSLDSLKRYFGMVPLDEYEDEYVDELEGNRPTEHAPRRAEHERAHRAHREERRAESADEYGYQDGDEGEYASYARRPARVESLAAHRPRSAAAATARAVPRPEPRPAAQARSGLFEDGGPFSKITTLRPRSYSEARIVGERYREGSPVIMDLVEMSNADAKRLVDFAAGLVFALHGAFDKVATKVFLLSPADIEVTAEERRRIAETGFYSQQ